MAHWVRRRLVEALAKLKPSKTMTTYFPQTGVKSYTEYETSWRLCTLSGKLPRPGTVLSTGFVAKTNELHLKKMMHSCNFQCVPSPWCCEEWAE